MKIEKDKFVSVEYSLTDDKGNLLDTTEGNEPLAFVYGKSTIIPALEKELGGKEQGYKGKVTIEPKDGYGDRDDSLLQTIDLEQFENPDDLSPGMQFTAQDEHGEILLTVIEVNEEGVLVDGNHPLAGITMIFDIEVKEVRDATEEELNPKKSCCGGGGGGCGCKH